LSKILDPSLYKFGGKMALEIERKWLIPKIPKKLIKGMKPQIINQAYLNYMLETRIREYTDTNKYLLTIKGAGDLSRPEVNIDIDRDRYLELYHEFAYKKGALVKEYYRVMVDNYLVEISKVDNAFIYAEIEFDSVVDSYNFKPFKWFGEEITYSNEYKMINYSLNKCQ
jgi:CYTH domain-containing protein